MREVKIGGKNYRVVASPITLFFYKKEFKTDLIGDMMSFQSLEDDITTFDSTILLQMAWAMAKTANNGKLVNFEQWLGELEYIDFSDDTMTLGIVEEAQKGFFRDGEQTLQQST